MFLSSCNHFVQILAWTCDSINSSRLPRRCVQRYLNVVLMLTDPHCLTSPLDEKRHLPSWHDVANQTNPMADRFQRADGSALRYSFHPHSACWTLERAGVTSASGRGRLSREIALFPSQTRSSIPSRLFLYIIRPPSSLSLSAPRPSATIVCPVLLPLQHSGIFLGASRT
jgi:hypothetical protein